MTQGISIHAQRLLAGIVGIVAILLIFSLNAPKVSAEYNAGRIIDDAVFLDAKSMSAADIQNFLVARGSGLKNMSFTLQCYGAGSTERQWYTAAGAQCDTPIPASHIIYYAAQIYGVNPKVILATMQKEQSLTTAANPTVWQLTQAMGYACPTSGSCSSSSSFPYQIDSGTWVLRYHFERARGNMTWWRTDSSWVCGTEKNLYKPNLYPGQNVRFHDTNGTHYTTIFIQNAATSSFYCYTPHVYNNPQGLYGRAPYGTTGLYYSGSYNFVHFYELWFGSTSERYRYSFETLVGASNAVIPSGINAGAIKSVAAGDAMYVFYGDHTTRTLRYAHWNGQSWRNYVLDGGSSGVPGAISAPVDISSIEVFLYNGAPQVYYIDTVSHTARHAFQSGGRFYLETLDGAAGSVLKNNRTIGGAISGFNYGNGQIQLYYFDTALGNLVHSWWNGQQWGTETLDGAAGSVLKNNRTIGGAISGTLGDKDIIQLYYYDSVNGDLVHSWFTNRWHTERLDGSASSVFRNSINSGKKVETKYIGGSQIVLYYDDAAGSGRPSSWRLAYTHGSWIQNILDGATTSKSKLNISVPLGDISAIEHKGSIQIFYKNHTGGITHSWLNK